jgi:hypothetical protein
VVLGKFYRPSPGDFGSGVPQNQQAPPPAEPGNEEAPPVLSDVNAASAPEG